MRTNWIATLFVLWMAPIAPAQLKVTPPSVNFGDHGHNEHPTETVLIENQGSAPVTIRELRPSCGCLTVDPPALSAPIPAGGSVSVKVTMSSGRAMGVLEKHITVTPADAGTRPVDLAVRMSVFDGLAMEPYDFHFDGVVGGEPVTRTIDVKGAARGRPPRAFTLEAGAVKDPRSSKAMEHFSSKVVDIPGGKRIELTLKPTHPEGRIFGNYEAKLDGRLFVVPVAGEMFRGIKIVPTYFNFNRVVADEPATFVQESVLDATDGKPFRILGITSQLREPKTGGIKVEVEDLPKGDGATKEKGALGHVLRATISRTAAPPKDTPAGGKSAGTTTSFSGTVTVTTDHAEKKTLTLQFFGFFDDTKKK